MFLLFFLLLLLSFKLYQRMSHVLVKNVLMLLKVLFIFFFLAWSCHFFYDCFSNTFIAWSFFFGETGTKHFTCHCFLLLFTRFVSFLLFIVGCSDVD